MNADNKAGLSLQHIAVIDIGSNSVRYMVCEYQDENVLIVERGGKVTRLVEGKGNGICSEAIARTVSYLNELVGHIRVQWNAPMRAFVTEALRSAENRQEVLKALSSTLHPPDSIKVLSSKEEALLETEGVVRSLSIDHEALIIDVGGGSTEIIHCDGKGVSSWDSVPIGAVVLKEELFVNREGSEAVARSREYLRNLLSKESRVIGSCKGYQLCGCGGTMTTLARIVHKLDEYNPELINGTVLERAFVQPFIEKIAAQSDDERAGIKGLPADRRDIILPGAIIVDVVMDMLDASSITVSHHGILWGAANRHDVLVP